MEPPELLRLMAEVLERLQVRYLVAGSMASIAYGEPRFTNDIDIVVELRREHIDPFCEAFGEPDFYCARSAVVHAVATRFQFNVVHTESGIKVDLIVATDSEFDRQRFLRAVRITDPSFTAWFASPEDIILKKLQYYREGRSDKHIRDIAGVLKVQAERIDRAYIAEWVAHFGLDAEWQLALERAATPFP